MRNTTRRFVSVPRRRSLANPPIKQIDSTINEPVRGLVFSFSANSAPPNTAPSLPTTRKPSHSSFRREVSDSLGGRYSVSGRPPPYQSLQYLLIEPSDHCCSPRAAARHLDVIHGVGTSKVRHAVHQRPFLHAFGFTREPLIERRADVASQSGTGTGGRHGIRQQAGVAMDEHVSKHAEAQPDQTNGHPW